jgi:hypothetical protein
LGYDDGDIVDAAASISRRDQSLGGLFGRAVTYQTGNFCVFQHVCEAVGTQEHHVA